MRSALRTFVAAATALTIATTCLESSGQTWVKTNGPMGSDVTAIGFHSSGALFACTWPRGVFRSNDDGQSWEYVGLAGQEIRGVIEQPDGSLLLGSFSSGVYRSTDSGTTWTALNAGLTDRRVHSIAGDGNGNVLVGTYGAGVFIYDAEAGWTAHVEGLEDLDIRSVAFDPQGRAYAASFRTGVFYSPGGRRPWTKLNGGSGISILRSVVADDDKVVVGGWNGGIAHTSLGDTSWTHINAGLPNQKVWRLGIAVDGQIIAGMHSNGIYRYSDAAAAWESVGLVDNVISAIALRANGEMWVGARTGIYRADNARAALTLVGVPKSVVYAIRQTGTGALLAATEQDGVFRTEDRGENWLPSDLQVTDVFSLAAVGDLLVAGSTFGYLYRSDDDGLSWTRIDRGPGDAWVADPVVSIAVGIDQTIYAGSFGGGVLTSDDAGESWKHGGLSGEEVTSVAADGSGVVYAGTFSGLFATSDRGETWVEPGAGLTQDSVRSVWADPDGAVYAGTVGNGVFRLSPGAGAWEPFGLDRRIVTDLRRGGDGSLYAATYGEGVFQHDGSGEWRAIFEGLANPLVVSLGWSSHCDACAGVNGTALLAGTDGDGVFLLPIVGTDVQGPADVPSVVRLEPNFPNPFGNHTTISFSLASPGDVTLDVFDLLGRRLSTVVSRHFDPGRHTVRWRPETVSDGVYLYTLTTGTIRQHGLMTRRR